MNIGNLLRGVKEYAYRHGVISTARGVIEAGAVSALGEAAVAIPALPIEHGWWQVALPVIVFAVRRAEGAADSIDPEKRRDAAFDAPPEPPRTPTPLA